MSIVQAVVLGFVQGITEFFPISSSGHLILVPVLFGWAKHPLDFDAALHLGTGLAVLVYFWRDWVRMLCVLGGDLWNAKYEIRKFSEDSQRLLFIVLASVPAATAGLLGDKWIERHLRSPLLVAAMLFAVALLMLLAEKVGSKLKERTDLASALLIGFSQVLALIPGVSRSGITMVTGLFCGLQREEAVRFSFLLAMPVTLGAGLWGLLSSLSGNYPLLLTGLLISFFSGLAAIRFLLNFVKHRGLIPFAIYRIILAIFLLIFLT